MASAMDLLKSANLTIAEATMVLPALVGQTPGSSDASAGTTQILVKGMQRILSRGLGWPDLKDDGFIGPKTNNAATRTLGEGWMRKYWSEVYTELVTKWQSGWNVERQQQINKVERLAIREKASTEPVKASFMHNMPSWAWYGLVGFAAWRLFRGRR